MTELGQAILTLLDSVGADVYAARAPQKARAPYVIYQQIFRSGIAFSLDGPSPLVQAEMQIDSYAATQAGAHGLADLIRQTLNGYRGSVAIGQDSPPDTVRIGAVRLTNQLDLPDDGTDPKLFRVMQEYLFTFDET